MMTMPVKILDRKYRKPMRWDECYARLPSGLCIAVEVGVWAGGTCIRLLAAHKQLTMHLVDPWIQAPPGSSYANSGSTNAHKDHDKVYRACMQRLEPYRDRVAVHRMMSVEAAPLVHDDSADVVFIDGDHSYEGVSTDIAAWLPKVRPGGWIGGHDFGRKKHYFPGVEKAVRESFGSLFQLGGDSTWWHQC